MMKFILLSVCLILILSLMTSCDILDLLSQIELPEISLPQESSPETIQTLNNDESLPDQSQTPVSDSPPRPSPEDIPAFDMVRVPDGVYSVPTKTDDSEQVTVHGGFYVAKTEVTYELWYAVRVWAENNGYVFIYPGMESPNTEDGSPPTDMKNLPVSRISWSDAIVWCNALSEMEGRQPVYRTEEGTVLRDPFDNTLFSILFKDKIIQSENDGYRLPLNSEWNLIARYIDGTNWTPGEYASGATKSYMDRDATDAVSWHQTNSGMEKQPVAQLMPNALGLYDVSGNVSEFSFELARWGGAYDVARRYMRVGYSSSPNNTLYRGGGLGFRIYRD